MPIGAAPINDRGDGQPMPVVWATWFGSVWRAIAGWRTTLTGTVTIDFGSIAANTQSSGSTLTLTGAETTDLVIVQADQNTSGIIYTAYCAAADVITIRACNFTAGAIDPPSTTFRVIVFKQ